MTKVAKINKKRAKCSFIFNEVLYLKINQKKDKYTTDMMRNSN